MALRFIFAAAAVSLVPLCLAEPPPQSYLPPFDVTAPAQQSFSGYASPKPFYSAPSPAPEYGAPSAAPYRQPQPPRRMYSSPKPVRFSPPPPPVYSAPASPAPVYSAPASPPPATYLPAATGSASSYDSHGHNHDDYQSEPANYMYHYAVRDDHFGTDFGHKESRDGDTAQGQYMVLLPDGRRQIVEYIADKNGYRPTIRYEGEGHRHGLGGGQGSNGPY